MGPKPWVQNDESKTVGVDYSRSLTKSLFYFIWLFGSIMGPKPWVQNHEPKTMGADY